MRCDVSRFDAVMNQEDEAGIRCPYDSLSTVPSSKGWGRDFAALLWTFHFRARFMLIQYSSKRLCLRCCMRVLSCTLHCKHAK